MVEPILNGIVLGLIPITIGGLLWNAYVQYKRSQRLFQEMVDSSEKR